MRVPRLSLPFVRGAVGFVVVVALGACTPATPPAEAPSSEAEATPPPSEPSTPAPATTEDSSSESENTPPPAASTVPEPQFPENASVDAAIKAVPQGVERRNIDPETLGKPLQDLALYEPCKPGAAKVKMRIAVWDGKAVGIDITTTPNNPKLADCIKGKLREITWEKKVKSLNTIEYQF
jgi:hypothetical protein